MVWPFGAGRLVTPAQKDVWRYGNGEKHTKVYGVEKFFEKKDF